MKKILIMLFIFGVSIIVYAKHEYKNSKNCVIKNSVCLSNDGADKYIIVSGKKYPSISYYDEITIKQIDNNHFQIINFYTDKSPVTIYSNFYLKKGVLYIDYIETLSYPNISPLGAKENCKLLINNIFDQSLESYVDNMIFDLNKSEKKKICTITKNK